MKVIRVENQVEGAKVALEILKEKLAQGAKTLGLATGSSPIEFYKQIIASDLDLSDLTSVNLDEYVGLSEDNPQSYRYFMNEQLVNKKPFKESFLPNGVAEDVEAEVKRYNQVLADHPVDLQILGIGTNGHIGFNEPGTSFDSTVHIVDLEQSTIQANARFFDKIEDVPTQAIAGTVRGEVTETVPASALQGHEDVVIIADKEALSLLEA